MFTTLYYLGTPGISSRRVLGICSPGYKQVILWAKLAGVGGRKERESKKARESTCS